MFQFYRKKSSKVPLYSQVFSQLQSDWKLFQQIITLFIIGTGSSTSLTLHNVS